MVLYNGAGFITVLLGNIMTMPGLPSVPNYEKIDLDLEGNIIGLFWVRKNRHGFVDFFMFFNLYIHLSF